MYKPLQAAGMSADNVRIWVIVRKMNIWPEKRSLQGECEILRTISQPRTWKTESQKGVCFFRNPPSNFLYFCANSKFKCVFFYFPEQHLRSAFSFRSHWTSQNWLVFLPSKIIKKKKWNSWAGLLLDLFPINARVIIKYSNNHSP